MTPILDLFRMWSDTRQVVLTSLLAAIYAAGQIPFKVFQFLPGVTDVRPAVVLPMIFSLLFGPSAAWGAALGNTIGDLFGSAGPGTLFGFLGNLLFGYVPYRCWDAWRGQPARLRSAGDWAAFVLAAVAASSICALVIGWGIHLLGLYPFQATGLFILGNNLLMALVLGPPFLVAIQPRVARMNLLYTDISFDASQHRAPARVLVVRRMASLVLAAASLAGLAAGCFASTDAASDTAVLAAAAPFLAAALIAVALV